MDHTLYNFQEIYAIVAVFCSCHVSENCPTIC